MLGRGVVLAKATFSGERALDPGMTNRLTGERSSCVLLGAQEIYNFLKM